MITPSPATGKSCYTSNTFGCKSDSDCCNPYSTCQGSECHVICPYAPTYARFIANHNRKLSYDKAYEIASAVIGWSVNYQVDARLVMALLIAESDFNPAELSGPGATGLGQLMPGTARELGVRNPWNTNENLYGTVKYLKTQMDRYGATEDNADRLALALAAYNAGPGAVKKHGGVPPYRETQNYVRRILRTYRQLCGA
jgi:soluble lytic murein transglycosylase-like protein